MEAMRLPFATRLAFVLLVVAEIAVIVLTAQWLGGWPVFWLIIATGLVGGWVVRREGIRAWSAVGEAVRTGRVPEHDMAASGLVVTGGFLLILPGFVTDLLGALLLVPATRPAVRRMASGLLPLGPGGAGPATRGQRPPPGGSTSGGGPVIEGEVVHPDKPDERNL